MNQLDHKYHQAKHRKTLGLVDIESTMAQVREANAEMEMRIQRNLEKEKDKAKGQKVFELKAYELGALPKKKGKKLKIGRPIPGVSYLSTTGLYDEMMANNK